MLLLIDNFDSFTHNLARYFIEIGQDVRVVRNNDITIEDIERLSPDYLVISPGPCTPNDAGISLSAISHFAGKIPIFGVCLGHQAIGQVFGANVVGAQEIKHGKVSPVMHNDHGLFDHMTSPFNATRYHSLVLSPQSLPQSLESLAWCETKDGEREIMAIKHKTLPVWGVQFHPESLLTDFGHQLLKNFIALASQFK